MAHRGYRQKLGERFSEGARQMWIEIERRDWTGADLASRTHLSPAAVFRYLWGDRLPERMAALKIQKVIGVAPRLFDVAPKRTFLPPSARAA